MAYGMKTYNAQNVLEFDSTSYGGIPVELIELSTTADSNNPTVIRYTAQEGRTLTVIPLVSGDYLYKIHNPYEGYAPTGNYPQISYWAANPNFSPSLSTHGFVKKPTKILVLVK
jgi:hypothetical protein